MTRKEVYETIDEERNHQDKKWGTIEERPHEVGAWITLMEKLLNDAKKEWATRNGDLHSLDELRKVLSVGVACAEQHGLPRRI